MEVNKLHSLSSWGLKCGEVRGVKDARPSRWMARTHKMIKATRLRCGCERWQRAKFPRWAQISNMGRQVDCHDIEKDMRNKEDKCIWGKGQVHDCDVYGMIRSQKYCSGILKKILWHYHWWLILHVQLDWAKGCSGCWWNIISGCVYEDVFGWD